MSTVIGIVIENIIERISDTYISLNLLIAGGCAFYIVTRDLIILN